MPREASVNFCNQLDRQADAFSVGLPGLQRTLPEIFVDVPHGTPVERSRHSDESRAPVGQSDSRQPASRDQFIASADAWIEPFHDPGAGAAVLSEAHSMNSSVGLLQRNVFDELARRVWTAEQISQGAAQLHQAGLPRLFKQLI